MKSHAKSFVMLLIILATALPLLGAKPAAPPAAIAATSKFRCPEHPNCPIVETTAFLGVPEGVSGDFAGPYPAGTIDGKKVGTWVDGDHNVNFQLLSSWGRFIELDFTTPVSGNAALGKRQTYDAQLWVERVTVSGSTETVTGKLCQMAIGETAIAQTWILIRDDQQRYWKLFYDRLPYGGDYTTVTRLDATRFTIASSAAQRARLYWQAKNQRGAKDVDKGFFAMPFVMTVNVTCP